MALFEAWRGIASFTHFRRHDPMAFARTRWTVGQGHHPGFAKAKSSPPDEEWNRQSQIKPQMRNKGPLNTNSLMYKNLLGCGPDQKELAGTVNQSWCKALQMDQRRMGLAKRQSSMYSDIN
mgnify:CR=1 FL=1